MKSPSSTADQTIKTDRRIERSRTALRHALLDLLHEKEFDLISVEEISTRAHVGRATFYLHYRDKEDLLLEEFREIVKNRVLLFSKLPSAFWDSNQEIYNPDNDNKLLVPFIVFFEHAAQNVTLYRVLLRGKNSEIFSLQMRDIVEHAIQDIILLKPDTDETKIFLDVPVNLLAAYFTGAMLGTINWWLENNLPYEPHEMAIMFNNLFFPSLFRKNNNRLTR
jgi:AcrR family transcriptional regulator